jgi:hypothetical protein
MDNNSIIINKIKSNSETEQKTKKLRIKQKQAINGYSTVNDPDRRCNDL